YDRAAEFITAACQVADMPLDQDALLDGYARWLNDVAGAVLAFPAPALLDQSRAVALARKSCELSGYRTGAFVSTLRDALLNNGKSTEADAVLAKGEACCREVIGRQPGDALPLMDLGDLLKLQRRLPEALTAYTQATQLKPDMPQAWAALGECHRLADNLAKMAEDYSQAIALNPNRQWYWHERGYAYMRLGDQRRALPDHTKAIELGDGDAGERVRRAVAYEGLGEFANAEADYARAIEINRASDEVWRAQYEFYQRRGQADRALPALAKAIALVAASPEAQNNLAWALATDSNPAVRDLKTAIAIATKACQSSNYHTAGFINTLVVALTKQVDGFRHQNNDMGGLRQACLAAAEACHEAAPYYEKLTKSRARHEEPWLFAGSCERLSQLLRDMDEPKAAERGYRDAWSIWSKLAASFDIEDDRWHEAANCNLLGDLLGATGRGDEAAETYRRALSIWERLATETRDPDRRNHLCWTRTALARLFRSQGKTDAADAVFRDAEAACREAAAMQPTAAEPQLLLGDLLQSQDKFSEAKGAYTEAIRLKPEWPELWAARAECQRRDGKSADVVDDYSRAIALKPDRQWYWHERADAYACLGKWTDALPDHCRAIELGDNDAGERRRRGDCYRALGQFKDAEADYSRAIELDPADGEQWYDRWAIRNQMGETDLAKADLKQAQAWCISAGAEQQNMLAWYLVTSTDLQVRDAPLAVRLAKAAVIARSDWGEAWNTLGVAQYRSGDWAGAIESLNRSMSLRKGGSAEDWYFLAMASHQLGQQTEAAAWYRRAVRSAQVPSGEMRVFKAEADALMPPSVTGQPVTQTPAATQLAH
ncbi:MAG TPA: tetratricopeptide repeat protein, partial [Tepidisphaeraceae bacterium]|nr:tetratricopeptide repeat protein [Tepidisphaeraceae bacterium]